MAPKFTLVAPVKLVPVMVTVVPPGPGPLVGEMPVTVGAAVKVYWSALVVGEVPAALVTVMSTVPAAWAGEVTVSEVEELTMTPVPAVAPNLTVVVPLMKFAPVTITVAAPPVGPAFGLTPLTMGAYVNWSLEEVADGPPPVVTTISIVPPVPAGEVAVIEVAELTVYVVAALPPKVTEVTPVKLVPVMTTLVPPAPGPLFGLTPVTVGGAM